MYRLYEPIISGYMYEYEHLIEINLPSYFNYNVNYVCKYIYLCSSCYPKCTYV